MKREKTQRQISIPIFLKRKKSLKSIQLILISCSIYKQSEISTHKEIADTRDWEKIDTPYRTEIFCLNCTLYNDVPMEIVSEPTTCQTWLLHCESWR
jgi:hypothetical protein